MFLVFLSDKNGYDCINCLAMQVRRYYKIKFASHNNAYEYNM